MIDFFKENLYGWGVCQIPMPRARNDIYSDRRRAQRPTEFADRRASRLFLPFAAVLMGILREDFPVVRTLSVALFATMLLLLFGLFVRPVPPELEVPAPPPVEIVTRMLQEPVSEPPTPVTAEVIPPPPPAQPVLAEKPPVLQPVAEPIPPQPKKIVTLPPSSLQPQPRKEPTRAVQPVARPTVMPKKVVSLAAPARQEPSVTRPAPTRTASDYTVGSNRQPQLVSERQIAGSRSSEPLLVTPKSSPAVDYRLQPGTSGQQALRQARSFTPTAAGTTVDLPTAPSSRSDFSAPRSQGGHVVAQAGRSFAPAPGHGPVEIAAAGPVAGSYAVSSGPEATAGPSLTGNVGEFAGPAAAASVDLPIAPGRGVVAPVVAATESAAGSGLPDSSVHFVGEGDTTADPNLFISLNQLDACVDQSEEDRLRTELAIRLDKGGVFPCGAMKFHIDYVETGQTVQMRIYNPRDFADKCAALLSAIECINHSK